MKRLALLSLVVLLCLAHAAPAQAAGPVTRYYPTVPWPGQRFHDYAFQAWDLTACDLTVSYRLDLSRYIPPAGQTQWTSVGVGDGAWGVLSAGAPQAFATDPALLDMDDKLSLSAPGRWDELSYDATAPGTVVSPIGSYVNYGLWFDRDGVAPSQATMWGMVDENTYGTRGLYDVAIVYHAIGSNLGTMFALVNDTATGFYAGGWHTGPPDVYPAGKSITGDLTRLRVYSDVPNWSVGVRQLRATGCR